MMVRHHSDSFYFTSFSSDNLSKFIIKIYIRNFRISIRKLRIHVRNLRMSIRRLRTKIYKKLMDKFYSQKKNLMKT